MARLRKTSGARTGARDRGSSAIEMAFIAPVLILFIFFVVQAALFFYGKNVAVQSAREGVSQLRLLSDREQFAAGSGDIERYTENFASSIGRESLIGAEATSRFDGEKGEASMTVTGRVISLVPGLKLTASGEASGQIERFEPAQ
ncbi:TadE/TadG family type IV pilus assembly protein [Saxibacter everestensis]|uniref:TadE/TadG family type IV pilus assembly protein n=1 Tax=Saxibacter everestensis TaxID=2909229 RepID=A0ABY8QWN6_9MICO|nr:TadE/TadG family type IV pilus assembly protein [Brevibacteriaceae bacterium ZFBP1038]